jgi:hypothetical protein
MNNPRESHPFRGDALRKLLRCKRTKIFLAKDGTWTAGIQKALELSDHIPEAIRSKFKPGELEVYYSFEGWHESDLDFALPVK